MKKLSYLVHFLAIAGLLAPAAAPADETIWKSGRNLYFTLTEQDERDAPPNQHPVTLNPKEITSALQSLITWEKHFFKKDEQDPLFSVEQARMLGNYLSTGLAKATPRQDIIFALARKRKGFLGIQDLTYMAGRAFFADNRLNIIIGDYDRSPDKFQERAQGSAGITEIKYYFSHGRRDKASGFDKGVITGGGVYAYEQGGRVRPDWIQIDVGQAAATFLAEQRGEDPDVDPAASEAMRREAARLAQERRELRLEMARLRKEMGEGGGAGGAEAPVEERLKKLDELRDKQLITEEEYAAKRREILNDI